MSNLIFKAESYLIRGAAFEAYKEKGCGFHESVYHECMEIELGLRKMPFVSKPIVQLDYKGTALQKTYEPDLICFEKIVVELKALSAIADEHRAQVLNYLKSTGIRLGLLINFGHHPKVQIERIVL